MRGIIQVAGIIDKQEAKSLIEAGVDWLGFPLRLPSHQEDLTETEVRSIIQSLKLKKVGVLITYLSTCREIFLLCQELGVGKVQLHGEIQMKELILLRSQAPDLFVIKSLIIRKNNQKELLNAVKSWSSIVDAFITDTYDPTTGACGATGKKHDWSISRELVANSTLPILLAGGINPHNVRHAIEQVRPAGVDAHTGLEGKDGRKDMRLVRTFVNEARKAFLNIF